MTEAKASSPVADVPLFQAFDSVELDALAELCTEETYRKGATVWVEGDEASSFLVVLHGELEIVAGEAVVARLGPGDFLGETGLLLDETRTATVRASRPTNVLVISATDFRASFAHNAKVLEYLSRILSQRLATRNRDVGVDRSVTVVGVRGEPGISGRSLVAASLAAMLAQVAERPTLLLSVGVDEVDGLELGSLSSTTAMADHIDSSGAVPHLRATAPRRGTAGAIERGVDTIVGVLGPRFPTIVVDVGGATKVGSSTLAQACDVLVELVSRPGGYAEVSHASHTRIFEVLNLYDDGVEPVPLNRCDPYILPVDLALVGLPPDAAAQHLVANPWSPAAPPLFRLARKILGVSIGIALGGGAAFGIAHIGVLQVLERAGIPIDLISGTSMGSIVALGFAGGLRPDAMETVAARIGNVRTVLSALDVTIGRPGLLRGDRLIAIFGPLLGSVQTFEQLQIPAMTVATDIETGERICLGEGRLDAAFRASSSVPMIWTPVRRDGRVLVDGAMVDPVPAEVVLEMGADICIAVNVVPQLRKGVTTALQRAYKRVNALNPLSYTSGSRDMPNFFDLMMNSLQTLQYELGNFKAIAADVRINVDLAEFTWIDFHRSAELMERGRIAAEQALPDIQRRLAEVLPSHS